MKNGIPLVEVLEEYPHSLIYIKYGDKKEGTREVEVSSKEAKLPIGTQFFQSKRFDWIAVTAGGKPYLLGYGDFDWLLLSTKVSGRTEDKLLMRYSELYSNEKLESEGFLPTMKILKDFTQRVRAFLPEKVYVGSAEDRILSMASLENGEYEYAEIKPSEFFLCMNVIPVIRLPRNTLVEIGGRYDEAKKIWLPRTHGR